MGRSGGAGEQARAPTTARGESAPQTDLPQGTEVATTSKSQSDTYILFSNVTAMWKQAWDYVTGPASTPYHYFLLVETHIESASDLQHWTGQARKSHL
eukprot:4563068-Pyramimonas_sp.AAC.1